MLKKYTGYISRRGIDQLINAFSYSEYINKPFSIFFVIAWNKTKDWKPDVTTGNAKVMKLREGAHLYVVGRCFG